VDDAWEILVEAVIAAIGWSLGETIYRRIRRIWRAGKEQRAGQTKPPARPRR
jgi:hypothetical protein